VIPANLAAEFVAAGHAYKIPPEILAGVAQEETGMGANRGPSSAGALGLMQFEPGTAHSLGINPLNDRQAIWGAAKYLHQLGYSENPDAALRKYNAGPAGPLSAPSVVAYARNVRTYAAQFGPSTGTSPRRPIRSRARARPRAARGRARARSEAASSGCCSPAP
jgi:soluble lytic murein transglycosylase-like protein